MYLLKNLGYLYTWGFWRAKIATSDVWTVAALAGKEFPKDPGKSQFGLKTLAGQYVDTLTDAQRQAIESYNGNHYTLLGDVGVTYDGKTASGEWMDVVRDLASLRVNLQYDFADLLISNDKIAFTDDGIGTVVTALRARLDTSVADGILADTPRYTITAPRAAAVSTANRQARRLAGVTFNARLAGSILKIQVRGRVAA